MGEIIAGRSMPLSIFSTNLAVAINAPVLPAETTAWARPSRTRLIATRIDEDFLVRKAFDGDSSFEISSLAGCPLRRSSVSAGSLRVCDAAESRSGAPTRSNSKTGYRPDERRAGKEWDRTCRAGWCQNI